MSKNPDVNQAHDVDDFLTWDEDWELMNGAAIVRDAGASFRHQDFATDLMEALRLQLVMSPASNFKFNFKVVHELDWHIDRQTVLRPDAVVIHDAPKGQWLEHTPDLAIEVISASTASFDMLAKRRRYAEAGLPLYLIADPTKRTLMLLRLVNDHYVQVDPVGKWLLFTLLEGVDVKLDTVALAASDS